jgi:cbb3-type cytochrome oxidase maturation protein
MGIILFLIAASLVLALGFLISFFWAVKTGQYDDDYTPSVRILLDDIVSIKQEKSKVKKTIDLEVQIKTEPKQIIKN